MFVSAVGVVVRGKEIYRCIQECHNCDSLEGLSFLVSATGCCEVQWFQLLSAFENNVQASDCKEVKGLQTFLQYIVSYQNIRQLKDSWQNEKKACCQGFDKKNDFFRLILYGCGKSNCNFSDEL